MYTAKLIKGSDYHVLDHVFKLGQEQVVKKEVYEYLKDNSAFEVTAEEQGNFGDEEHTITSLKKNNADQQKEIIAELGGDLESVKNEEERIALILRLQEQKEKGE